MSEAKKQKYELIFDIWVTEKQLQPMVSTIADKIGLEYIRARRVVTEESYYLSAKRYKKMLEEKAK